MIYRSSKQPQTNVDDNSHETFMLNVYIHSIVNVISTYRNVGFV